MDTDERRLATPEYEAFAIEVFHGLTLPPEEFAARHGHEFAMFSFDEYRYRRPGMDEWVAGLAGIFFAPGLGPRLRSLRERYLTPEEIARVEAHERDPF